MRKIENGEINPETELGIKKGRETPRSGGDSGDKETVSDMLNEMNKNEKKGWCCKSN